MFANLCKGAGWQARTKKDTDKEEPAMSSAPIKRISVRLLFATLPVGILGVHAGLDPNPRCHRARRSARRRTALAARVRRITQAGRAEAGAGETRPDAASDRLGP